MGTQRWLMLALVAVAAVWARPAEDAAEDLEPSSRAARAHYGSLKSQPPPWGYLYAPHQFRVQQAAGIPTAIHRLPSVYQPQPSLQPTSAPQSFQWNPPRDEGYSNLYTILNGQLVTPLKQPAYHIPLTTSRLPFNRSPFLHLTPTTYNQQQNDGPLKQLNNYPAFQKGTSGSVYWGSIQSGVRRPSDGLITPRYETRYDYTKVQTPPPRVGNFGVLGKHGFGNIFQKPKLLQEVRNSGDVLSNLDYKREEPTAATEENNKRNYNEENVTNGSSKTVLKVENVSNKTDALTGVAHTTDEALVTQIENLPVGHKVTVNEKESALLRPALSALREILDRRPDWSDSQGIMDWRKNYTIPNRPAGTTTLILKPEAEAVAGCNGTAIANPISHAVVPIGQPVDIHFEPRAVAVAGPGGRAKAHSDLVVSFVAAAGSEQPEEDATTSSPK